MVFDDSEPVQRILIAKVSDLNGIIEYLIIPVVFNVNKSFFKMVQLKIVYYELVFIQRIKIC